MMNIDCAIKMAIKNVVQVNGLTDIFPRPFELEFIKSEEAQQKLMDEAHERIQNSIKQGSILPLRMSELGYVYFPKKKLFDFRKAALIHPMDTILYLAIVLTYADMIEQSRIPAKKNVVFSYRLKCDYKSGRIFDKKFNFTKFRNQCREQMRKRGARVLVQCDIANYYDRLNLHRLESTLLSIASGNEAQDAKCRSLIELTNQLLLFWMNKDSYGLPVGGNASRILAEAALISIDDFLLSEKINFCRFVDDYCFFAKDAKTAHKWLAMFAERLHLEGLAINASKTKITDMSNIEHDSDSSPFLKYGGNYEGNVPIKFRSLSSKEKTELQNMSPDELKTLKSEVVDKDVLSPNKVERYLRVLIAREMYDDLCADQEMVSQRYPQLIPYIIDILTSKSGDISNRAKEQVRDYYSKILLRNHDYPEYIYIAILKLLKEKDFASKKELLKRFTELRRNAGAYLGRSILESLIYISNKTGISRSEAISLRRCYTNANQWEKRALIPIVCSALPADEQSAWLRNIKLHQGNDYFACAIIQTTLDKLKRQSKKKIHKMPKSVRKSS